MPANEPNDPPLSVLGVRQSETGQFVLNYQEKSSDFFDPQRNPNGFVNMGIAENSLLYKELIEYFDRNLHLGYKDFTYGDAVTGDLRLRTALSKLLNARFKPHQPVVPEHIIMGSGLIAVVSQLSRSIANSGDGVLIAEPYYQGFDVELQIQNGIVPVGVVVPSTDMFTSREVTHLEKALHESNANGTIIKAVILCNPHNPLGICYPREVILDYCRFCEKYNLHLISDEIYALSVFSSVDVRNPAPFISALSLDLGAYGINPARLHILYGMSKDFNANGFRIGALITQSNPDLLRSMTVAAFFMLVSSPASALWSTFLEDQSFLQHFIISNQQRLREAYEHLSSWLRYHKLPYVPSSAGHFLLVNMRPVLEDINRYGPVLGIASNNSHSNINGNNRSSQADADKEMREREAALTKLLEGYKVLLISGALCHAQPGWFRFTFAIRRDFIDVGMKRIEIALGWDDGWWTSKRRETKL
ncbi:hypothetical protein AMATHDRAFT_71932 [Amanita thiersii Skay4041]|uniref:Aminotransferase class I/classII large domain-containing protein n=1 Tax=Amanita thiersii Skay4041 TaxID=703135 RepID=A0A2A9NAA7_9AGAR|nr:hypothetical protein AMATHDRAFT_71932 [Amanita thiersii Skay4041]